MNEAYNGLIRLLRVKDWSIFVLACLMFIVAVIDLPEWIRFLIANIAIVYITFVVLWKTKWKLGELIIEDLEGDY